MPLRHALMTGTSLLTLTTVLAATLATLPPRAALAQSTADLIELDAITVTGDPTAPVAGYVADLSSTATKTSTPILEVPQSVSVVTGDQIEHQGATTLGDTLGYTAGLNAQPFGTDPRFDAPVLRGFDGADAQYLNGLRVLRSQGAPSFEIYSTERIEVLKGPASVLYGSGIPGGVINQVQKRAYDQDFGEAGIGIGNPQASEVFLDWNKVLSDRFSARLTTVVRDSEQDIEALSNRRGYLGLATRWTPSDTTELQFLMSYQKDDPSSPVGVPADLLGTGRDDLLRSFNAGDPALDDSDRTTANIGFELRQDLAAGWELNAAFRYQDLDWTYDAPYVRNGVSDGDTITRGMSYVGEDSTTADIDLRLGKTFVLGQSEHAVLLGLEQRRYAAETSFDMASLGPISLSNPVYDGGNPGPLTYESGRDITLRQTSLYAQDEIRHGNWRGSLALRHDWADQDGTARAGTAITDASTEAEATTGRIGLGYAFANGVTPYASYATSFDLPATGTDIDGAPLKPTEGKQWELGVKYQPAGLDAMFTASAYELTQTNIVAGVTENGISGNRQIGEARARGIELEATANLFGGLDLRAAYAWNDTEQTRGNNRGAELPNAPEHSASLWLNYSFADGAYAGGALDALSLGGGLRYIGARYGDAANSYEMEDVTLLDLRAAYDLSADTQVSVNVTNVTDRTYAANCSGFGCRFGDGRAVQARLTHKW